MQQKQKNINMVLFKSDTSKQGHPKYRVPMIWFYNQDL